MKESEALRVRLRNGFSDRMGTKTENKEIQLTQFDDRTRTVLANAMNLIWNTVLNNMYTQQKIHILIIILAEVYNRQVKYNTTYRDAAVLEMIVQTISNDEYDAVLTVIEYLINQLNPRTSEDLYSLLNNILNESMLGFVLLMN